MLTTRQAQLYNSLVSIQTYLFIYRFQTYACHKYRAFRGSLFMLHNAITSCVITQKIINAYET